MSDKNKPDDTPMDASTFNFVERGRTTCRCGEEVRFGYVAAGSGAAPALVGPSPGKLGGIHMIPVCKDFTDRDFIEYLKWLREDSSRRFSQ